jgi:hypothetical protein
MPPLLTVLSRDAVTALGASQLQYLEPPPAARRRQLGLADYLRSREFPAGGAGMQSTASGLGALGLGADELDLHLLAGPLLDDGE